MKRTLGISLLISLLFLFVSMPVSAEVAQVTASGFYNIETEPNVTITPKAFSGSVKTVTTDINNDGVDEVFYANSDMLTVEYTDASQADYYGVVLVEGNELPNKDNEIYYIDQVESINDKVTLNVYPSLPEKNTDLTLYISSSEKDSDLITIRLKYTVDGTYGTDASYILGDVNNDTYFNSTDSLLALQIAAGLYEATDDEELAANVNSDEYINATDALMILQYGAGIIDSWD